ncbi:MAG: thermopsin family protease [Thermoplasmatales archaeon]|nr:thermopsin family protease [Thermoplasmatales archaeon]
MTRKLLIFLVLVISFAMLIPGLALFQNSQAPTVLSTPSVSATTPTATSGINQITSPTVYNHYFPPNFHAKTTSVNGVVTPSYVNSPAPMGVGSYGVSNTTGTITGYVLNASSFEGTAVLNNLTTLDLTNDGPDQYTMQLNTILRNVTLFGNSSFVFWNQNVLLYTAHNHTNSFQDNIWNFSSPAFLITSNSFYSYDGNIIAPVYYYAVGPSLTVTYPFTVHLYLNSTVINNRDAVFFNYSVITTTGTFAGSYDKVIFNSTYGMPSTYKTPSAYYQINGFQLTPTGFIPYDAELMIGGPGGGSQTNIMSINGTMTLGYLPAGTTSTEYLSVPSAYDFGSDTGETSSGIAEWWSGNTVHLGTGPSILYPMWNISSASGHQTLSGTVTPTNSFIFISNGTFDDFYAGWAPVSNDGSFSYQLPTGTYSGEVLMSDYNPMNFTFNSSKTLTVSLQKNVAKGVYTPLVAMNNQQLKYISTSGNGTQSSPYILENNQYFNIDPLFWEYNDYLFPVFSGILLANTNAYVLVSHAAPFMIDYPSFTYAALQYYGNLPTFNFMPTELYNASHVSIMNSVYTGWFYSNFQSTYGYPVIGNILTWNSSSILIAHNNFLSMGASVTIYGGTGNMIWGNYFEQSESVAPPSALAFGMDPIGLSIYSSNNTIYNNNFDVLITTLSPAYNVYNGATQLYNNTWNVTSESASTVSMFNGQSLSGSVVNDGFVSGNVYWDEIPGQPYNDSGFVASGYDYSPVVPTFYNVTVTLNNVMAGKTATVYLVQNSFYQYLAGGIGSSSVTIPVYNGTYFIVVVANGQFYFNYQQQVTVNGSAASITINL